MSYRITLKADTGEGLAWAQQQVAAHHYLRKAVDVRSRPMAYLIEADFAYMPIGCLIFGRPEATRCYDGGLSYGSQADVERERASYDRWSVLNLARVWLDPAVQAGGRWCGPAYLPGYTDRRGVWRSRLASWCIEDALSTVGYDYLRAHPPVWVDQPYEIEAVLSYCDLSRHKGTIYRAAGWQIARRNERGIETWWTPDVCPLSSAEDDAIRRLAEQSERSRRLRARAQVAEQHSLEV